jgi:hypothetical protein
MAEHAVLERPSFGLAYEVAGDDVYRAAELAAVPAVSPVQEDSNSSLDGRLTALEAAEGWFKAFLDRVTYLSAVPIDPREAQPLNTDDLSDAVGFLSRVMHAGVPTPWIGRLNSGGLQLSWTRGEVEVEAVFDRAGGEKLVMFIADGAERDLRADEADSMFASVSHRLVPTSNDRHSAS